LDSFLDLLSGSIIFMTSRIMKQENKYLYPAGKSRLEPVGIIVIHFIAMHSSQIEDIFILYVYRHISVINLRSSSKINLSIENQIFYQNIDINRRKRRK